MLSGEGMGMTLIVREKIVEDRICIECKEEDHYGQFGYFDGSYYCNDCFHSDMDSTSTIYRAVDDKVEKQLFTKIFALTDDGDETYDWFDELLVDKTKSPRNYVQTDGWRGYYDSSKNFNLVSLASGWTTGWADETTKRKLDFNDFANKLLSQEIQSPYEIFILVEPTSNVFSTAVDVLVKESDRAKVEEWMENNGYAVSSIQHALS